MSGTLSIGDKTVLSHDTNTDVVTLGNATTASSLNIKSSINASGDAPVYAARAWVNFDGKNAFSPNPSTSAIRDSGNVSSITDNGTGDYTVNFTTAMPDANYAISGTVSNTANNWVSFVAGTDRGVIGIQQKGTTAPTTSSVRIETLRGSNTTFVGELIDFSQVTIAIFR